MWWCAFLALAMMFKQLVCSSAINQTTSRLTSRGKERSWRMLWCAFLAAYVGNITWCCRTHITPGSGAQHYLNIQPSH